MAGVRLYIIIFPVNYSRWVRAFSCRVAAHETDSLDDWVGGVDGVWEERTRYVEPNINSTEEASTNKPKVDHERFLWEFETGSALYSYTAICPDGKV